MTFVAQLVRTPENEPFLGRIELLRLFVDYDALYGADDPDSYALWVSVAGEAKQTTSAWAKAEFEELEARFGTYAYGVPFLAPRQSITSEATDTVDLADVETGVVPNHEEWIRWEQALDREEARYRTRYRAVHDACDTSLLGGHPSWVQYAEREPLPFFLQLYPEGPLMWGDGGHLYLFLDPEDPETGAILQGPMY